MAAAADRINELTRNLKSVLEREAETQARHDNKIDAIEAKGKRDQQQDSTTCGSGITELQVA